MGMGEPWAKMCVNVCVYLCVCVCVFFVMGMAEPWAREQKTIKDV